MTRFRLLIPILLLLSLPAVAQTTTTGCNLAISIDQCDLNTCRATTINNGPTRCVGEFFAGFFSSLPTAQLSFSGIQNTLGLSECFDTSEIPGATGEEDFCFGNAGLEAGQQFTSTINMHVGAGAPSPLPLFAITAVFDENTDEELAFVYATPSGIAVPTCTPAASVASITQSNVPYSVTWSPVSNAQATFQIDESTTADFSSGVTTLNVTGLSQQFQHAVTANTTYYYRVRALNCAGGTNSPTVQIVVQAPPPPTSKNPDSVVPFGSQTPVQFQVFVPGSGSGKSALDTSFTATTDKPYLSVSPQSGTIPPQGINLTITANPKDLPPGANTGTLQVSSQSAPTTSIPVSISLVTPVGPGAKSLPPGNALIIPVVTHVNGATSPFQSDVRLTNASSDTIKYQLTFTPTHTDGTKTSKVTTISVPTAQTVALNDITKDFFGFGATGNPSDVGFGSLEIRPLNSSSNLTFASSRTYATTSIGTLGQYIAAIPFSQFAGPAVGLPLPGGSNAATILSLQQIAQSAKFRTNLGLAEGSGSAASGRILIYNDAGTLLKTVPYSLMPGEHQQINAFLAANGISSLDDGRIEITVDSPTGAVTAYASVLDNLTTDPLAVQPAVASQISATRYVLPGMADLNNGAANFHSDIRIFNGGKSPVTVNLSYFPQTNPAAAVTGTPVTINAGEVKAFDNVLPSIFSTTNSGGSILMTTSSPSSLVATGRTYSINTNGGTFGQFIPGITPSQGIGVGDRPLHILQLEQSQNFRSNVGLAELTGNAVHVKVSLILPDSKVAPIIDLDLAGNEFRQLNGIIGSLNPGVNTYNARMTVQVTSGAGRVTAYGSVIDNSTQDPTYVPAQ